MGTPRVRTGLSANFIILNMTRRQLADRAMNVGLLTSALCLLGTFAAYGTRQPWVAILLTVLTVTNTILMGKLSRQIKRGDYNEE